MTSFLHSGPEAPVRTRGMLSDGSGVARSKASQLVAPLAGGTMFQFLQHETEASQPKKS